MKQESIHSKLMEELRRSIPEQTELLPTVMEMLSLGKEAVYRRFRGDVPFTLEEALTISRRIGISLDSLAETIPEQGMSFDWTSDAYGQLLNLYTDSLDYYTGLIQSITSQPDNQQWDASNKLPMPFILKYRHLAKFHLMRWQMQMNETGVIPDHYEKMEHSDSLFAKQQEFSKALFEFERTVYIWDSMIIESLLSDLRYFRDLGMIGREGLESVKQELKTLVDEFERMSAKGVSAEGRRVEMYISAVNFESSYAYFFSDQQKVSLFKIYGLNAVTTRDEKVFQSLRKKINSLKKSATLITGSAEIVRVGFFTRQREAIETL